MNSTSETDWKRLAEMDDAAIDTDDMPELDDRFFEKAELQIPAKQSVTLRIDEDVLARFKAQSKCYQTRINTLRRRYMESQELKR